MLDISTGLFGRLLMQVGDAFNRSLPSHKFSVGDIVGIRVIRKEIGSSNSNNSSGGASDSMGGGGGGGGGRALYDVSGVVTSSHSDTSITIALDETETSASGGRSAANKIT